jgi:dolichyl-phosphate beta-glucosyltransferase
MVSTPQNPTDGTPFLSIVIPAYNEAGRIEATLRRVQEYVRRQPYTTEILVADDGSTDRTPDIVAACATADAPVRLLRHTPNRGKGFAVRSGMAQARGALVLFSDADLSAPIEEVEKLLPGFDQGFDVIIGSRSVEGAQVTSHQPRYREIMGRVFNRLVRFLTVRGLIDTQCGFKCFRREIIPDIFSRQTLDGFCFDVEILYIADRLGYRIREVPVRWAHSPQTTVRPLVDSWGMLIDLIRIRWRHRGLQQADARQPAR